ncbi:type II toxin-antitoxin system VapC family toxin [Cyanobium sp. ATX 6F1]|uniref:type II toxin-antitoxin system VapC family toxin n=1 Tax=unclassified Cyanobium TaxID=2627006 RepID=UPI0020CC3C5C|nr:PIN domain-containing protein [Cyanobium sp. ATX 6F1]MCP9915858.1 PIN domain-containing protein [Cyanobium sp. ATX 6F1]
MPRGFDAFFARPDLHWVELTRSVVEAATELRLSYGLRTPDALQAACCQLLGRNQAWMLTGDAAFQRLEGLEVRLLA